ncbi:12021_t:CDS:2 [Cetraspora pellucida]|uniref:12021_t:CDS:1 n=2 Tax=Cetraspora pellucida TaxID=1433469 RepID=A0A9N8ZBV5_9GLOM|nr:12021_t:CDS:2 [Cetraspora pellucida]
MADRFDPDSLLALEKAFLKVPLVQFRGSTSKAYKNFEKESKHIQMQIKQLQNELALSNKVDPDKVKEIHENIEKWLGSSKVEFLEAHGEGQKHVARGRQRVDHLAEVSLINNIYDPKYKEWTGKRADRVIVDYLLREGFRDTAIQLARESDIESLVDIDLFTEAHVIEQALRKNRCTEALRCTLEFLLRVQEVIELCRENKREEALKYSKEHFKAYIDVNKKSAQDPKKSDSQPGPIRRRDNVLYDPIRWGRLIARFRIDFYELNALPSQPLLNVTLQAGLSALKTPMCYQHDNKNIDCPVCSPDTLGTLAKGLPMNHHVNSTLVCRISKKIMNEDNYPMILPNGCAYSHDALAEMASKNNDKVTCPRTGEIYEFSKCKKLYIL